MQVAQFIKIIDAKPLHNNGAPYKNGDIMRITQVWENGDGCFAMGADEVIHALYVEEFEILDEGKSQAMNQVKEGQKIKVVKATPFVNTGTPSYKNGDILRVVRPWENGLGCDALTDEEAVVEVFLEEFEVLKEADAVNSPIHYNTGRFETIELIEAVTNGYKNGYLAYCIGNTLKYISRAPFKHATPVEDLQKAVKYLEFAIEALQREEGTAK